MHLLLSGEGKSDIGRCNPAADYCDGAQFQPGPMSIIIDQLLEQFLDFEMSHIDCELVSFVSEGYLSQHQSTRQKKAMALRGKKRPVETKYFYENARALAILAKRKSQELQDSVIAVLFRDSDGTSSAGRGLWRDKRDSMLAGFRAEDFFAGVAMVPKPKSEAWLLCALKENPYQHCQALEEVSGNDNSTHSLKVQLRERLERHTGTEYLNQLIRDKEIQIENIDMESFNVFKEDLAQAVNTARSR